MSGIVSSYYIKSFLKNGDINIFSKYEKLFFDNFYNYLNLAKHWYANNKSVDSWFWEARKILGINMENKYNRRAFVYISS